LAEADVAALMHEGLADVAGEAVTVAPFAFGDLFQSAPAAAGYIADCLETNFSWKQIEGFLNQCLAAEPGGPVRGMKVQIKGRLGKKADKASKRLWEHGLTSVFTFDDAVDFAEAAAHTRAGVIGVKVWLIYRPETLPVGDFTPADARPAPPALPALVAAPRKGPPPHAGSNVWWAALGVGRA